MVSQVVESSTECAALRHGKGRCLAAGEIDLSCHGFGSSVADHVAFDRLTPASLASRHVKRYVLFHPGLDLGIH